MRRLVALVLLLLGITFVAFVLTELVPSNAVATNLGEQAAADPAAVEAFKAHYGLDKPLPVRYAIYLGHLVRGDLGQSSLTHEAVTHDLGQFIPATAELAVYSILFAAVVGVAFGVVAGLRRNRPTDHALRVASLAGISMPTFWIALVALYVGFYRLGWFPGGQRLAPGTTPPSSITGLYTVDALLDGRWSVFGEALHHLLLPALVLAAFNVSLLTRFTRSAVLEVSGNDYVRAARAKGMPERIVVVRYILRAALPSVVTVLGLVFANVLTGAVLVEKIFSWPGVGQYAYQAAVNIDLPAIVGVSLFVAIVYVDGQLRRRRAVRGDRPEDPAHMTAVTVRRRMRAGTRRISPGLRQPLAITGIVIAAAWIVIAVFAPLLAPSDPLAQTFTPSVGPSWQHLFGTDELGRDVLSRVIYGARVTLPIALFLVVLAALIGGAIGAVAGYFRGPLDGVAMRGADLVFAFPPIILAMVVAAVLGRGLANAAIAIVVVSWPAYARVVRGLVLSVGDADYVQSAGCSARAHGARSSRTCSRTLPGPSWCW